MTSQLKLSGLKIFKKLPNFLRKKKSNDNNEYENYDRQLRPADYEESEYEERPPIPEFVGGEEFDIQVGENIDDEDFETNSVGNHQEEYYVEEEDEFYGIESNQQQHYDPNMYPPPEMDPRMRPTSMRTNGVPIIPPYMQSQDFGYNARGPPPGPPQMRNNGAPYPILEQQPSPTRAPSGGFFPPQPVPQAAPQQMAFTDSELMEFEQMVAHGMPEPEALRALQYNRMRERSGRNPPSNAAGPAMGPPSRGPSARGFIDYVPPVSNSNRSGYQLNEEEQLQIAMRASVEEENRRKQRIAQGDTSAKEAVERANERAMQLAIQRSYDEFERLQQASQRAAAGAGAGAGIGVNPQDPSSIEEANEKALKAAIMMSMAEASSSSPNMRSGNAPPPPSPANPFTPASRQSSNNNALHYSRSSSQKQQLQQSQPQMVMGPPMQRNARAMSMGSEPTAVNRANNLPPPPPPPPRLDIVSRQQQQQQVPPAPFLHSQSQQQYSTYDRHRQAAPAPVQQPQSHLQAQQSQQQMHPPQTQHAAATPQRFLQPKQVQRLISEEIRNSSPQSFSSRHALAVEGNINHSGSGSAGDALARFAPGLSLDVPEAPTGTGNTSSPRTSFRIGEQQQIYQGSVVSGQQTPLIPSSQEQQQAQHAQQPLVQVKSPEAAPALASSASSSAMGSPIITKFSRPRALMVQQIPPEPPQQSQFQRSKPRPGKYVEYEIEADDDDDEVKEMDIPEVDDED